MKRQIKLLTVPAFLLLFIALDCSSMDALAQGYDATRKKLMELFVKWDTNQDGKLNENEWQGKAPFEKVDTNGDNAITRDELGIPNQVGTPRMLEPDMWNRILKSWDANEDGKLQQHEWKGQIPFKQLDKNNDGAVTYNEIISEVNRVLQERSVPETVSSHDSPDTADEDFQRILKTMDMDRDGRVSESEWNGSPDMFGQLDQNKDNFITADEVK